MNPDVDTDELYFSCLAAFVLHGTKSSTTGHKSSLTWCSNGQIECRLCVDLPHSMNPAVVLCSLA